MDESQSSNDFAGKGNFTWWIGYIEDRNDPLKLGRCRVRIFGFHTDSLTEIPSEDLPWALAMLPLNNSKSFSVPMLGDWIVGFFLDGESAQFPVMMGVLPGYKQE